MEPYPILNDSTEKASKFVESFKGRLEELIKTNDLPPGMAIAILANLNFHGQDMPASVFRRLKYDLDWETPEDPIILAEVLKRIQNGKVIIDKTTRTRVGDFQLQYNFVRGFRPKRDARKVDVPLDLPFDSRKFNYGTKDVDPELFHSIKYDSHLEVDFVFNRYPFAPYHFLWIPNRKTEYHNQFLDATKDSHLIETAWSLVTEEGMGKSIRLCYNSNGAHASVNHLHLQGFFLTQDWEPPFEEIKRRDGVSNNTIDCYFKGTRWLSSSDGINGLKEFIEEMNKRYKNGEKLAYHFCMSPKGIACFPRKHQGDEKYFEVLQKTPFTTGFAFFEMLGEIISPTTDVSIFNVDKTEKRIRELYDRLSLFS